ncbi:MAG: hypothetical protein NTNFB02_23570 [Nitrospira sp.]
MMTPFVLLSAMLIATLGAVPAQPQLVEKTALMLGGAKRIAAAASFVWSTWMIRSSPM